MPIGRFSALASRCSLWSFVSRRRQSSSDHSSVSSYEEEYAAGSHRNASRRMARKSRQSGESRATTDTSWSLRDTDEEILSLLGTRSPCPGMGGRSGEPSDAVIAGQGLSDPDQTHPQAVSKLGHQARRTDTGP